MRIQQYQTFIQRIIDGIDRIQKKKANVIAIFASAVFYTAVILGFLLFPFFNYQYLVAKIVVTLIWLVFGFMYFDLVLYKIQLKDIKDAPLFIITFLVFTISLAMVFINNNYYSFGNVLRLILLIFIILFVGSAIYHIVNGIKKDVKKLLQALALASVFITLYFLTIGSFVAKEPNAIINLLKIVSISGLVAMVFGILLTKFFNKQKFKYIYIFAAIILGSIVLLVLISSLASSIDTSISATQTFITLLSAMLGGGLTVFGVAWTIKRQDDIRIEEERNKYRPFIYPVNSNNDFDFKQLGTIQFVDVEGKKGQSKYIGMIKNTDNGVLILKELIVDGKQFNIRYGDVLDKNNFAQIFLLAENNLEFNKIELVGTDIRGHMVKFGIELNEDKKDIARIIEK